MDFASFKIYVHNAFPVLPWWHWIVMTVVALGVTLILTRRKGWSTYATICLTITIFVSLFLLDGIVLNRLNSEKVQFSSLDIEAELHRLMEYSIGMRILMVFNVLAFLPFGAALSEFLCSSRSIHTKRCIWIVAFTAFGFSLLLECLQLLMKVGVFEVGDIVLNTLGAIIGATVALGVRAALLNRKRARTFSRCQ